MEKQEMEMKRKLEWKLETKMGTKRTNHWFYCCILLSNGYMTGFESCFAFTLVLCFVII